MSLLHAAVGVAALVGCQAFVSFGATTRPSTSNLQATSLNGRATTVRDPFTWSVATTAQANSRGPWISASSFFASAALAVAFLRRASTRANRSVRRVNNSFERKWWSIEETRDPTTLPLWQRDFRFGYQVLKRSMVEARKRGRKVFWEVRVLSSRKRGSIVEMMNSGIPGFIPIGEEGLADGQRLEVGQVYQVECLACPMQRINKELPRKPWPCKPRKKKANPVFSHFMWKEQQRAIDFAKTLKAGTIIEGTVYKHCIKGLVLSLTDEGQHAPKGMLAMHDISRKMTPHKYADKMFPHGTKLKCYVAHADTNNGRITLSTKEFEDDEHVGWMLSFPERCFAMADEAVGRYHEKRDAYIKFLQRGQD